MSGSPSRTRPFSRPDASARHEPSEPERGGHDMTDETISDLPDLQRLDALALGAALVTVLLWASAFVAIRDAGAAIDAGPLSLARLLVASAVLGLLVAVRREALPPRRDVPRLVLCGLLWFAAYSVVLNTAEQRVDAGTAAMLVNVGPVLIAVLAGLLLREGFPPRAARR